LPVAAMQNVEASVAAFGTPGVTAPAAAPFSVIVRQAALPKQPACVWLGQKRPPAFVDVAVPVVNGDRFTAMAPTWEPSMQAPPPGVQGWPASVPPVGQSRVTAKELVLVQAIPARGPRSHVPVPGLDGDPLAEHFGQGWARLPVR